MARAWPPRSTIAPMSTGGRTSSTEAKRDYHAAFGAGSKGQYVWYGLGQIAEAQKDTVTARDYYARAMIVDPNYALASERLAALGGPPDTVVGSSQTPILLKPPAAQPPTLLAKTVQPAGADSPGITLRPALDQAAKRPAPAQPAKPPETVQPVPPPVQAATPPAAEQTAKQSPPEPAKQPAVAPSAKPPAPVQSAKLPEPDQSAKGAGPARRLPQRGRGQGRLEQGPGAGRGPPCRSPAACGGRRSSGQRPLLPAAHQSGVWREPAPVL